MQYNFDEVIPRHNTNSVKWDLDKSPDLTPMWVADMDFKAPPEVLEALQERLSHGILGYSLTPPEFYSAVANWWKNRHGYSIEIDWIIATQGTLPALSAIIREFTAENDQILIITPEYNHFFITINNCSRKPIQVALKEDQGKYTFNFELLEKLASDHATKMILFSNPHNPVGRVYTKEELTKLGEICLRNDVLIVSDEIHCDLVLEGKHIPFSSISEDFAQNSVTCASPSKTFNLAGMQVGYVFTKNESYKKRIEQTVIMQDAEMISPMGSTALIAAYNHGEAWLEELLKYFKSNYKFLKDYLNENLPSLSISPLEGTYLVWVNIKSLGISSEQFTTGLREKGGVWLNSGHNYGEAGEGFIRINIACPRSILKEGLDKINTYINSLKN